MTRKFHSSTYRIQFNNSFSFADLEQILDYLQSLGIDAIYASPILKSTSGSSHGYDVTDPTKIDPELGGETGFESVIRELHRKNIQWIQDIVPNHMAYNSQNTWLWDVLENGRSSGYTDYFDIDWDHPDFNGKLMVPFLGKSFDDALRDGEIILTYNNGGFHLKYFDNLFPVSSAGFFEIFKSGSKPVPEKLNRYFGGSKEDTWLILPPWNEIKEDIDQLYTSDSKTRKWIDDLISKINRNKSSIISIHDKQSYVLCNWKQTESRINYRRFFTVNGLICLRMEDKQVFANYHRFLKQKLMDGDFSGLRIDHIDGLRDPGKYLRDLRKICGRDTYIVSEKILELHEELPDEWEIQGTTGYDFLVYVNNLLTNKKNIGRLKEFYRELTGINEELDDIIYEKKKFILLKRMAGELDNLSRQCIDLLNLPSLKSESIDMGKIKPAIAEFLLAFPVYRIYPESIPSDEKNNRMIEDVIKRAYIRYPELKNELLLIQDLFSGQALDTKEHNALILDFFTRCMQYAGPLMAKGVEDTTMYYYNYFIAHNEVGDNPGSEGLSTREFHTIMKSRQEKWPYSMNCTSTHDTKRGEDVRARLNVISDIPEKWIAVVKEWVDQNQHLKKRIDGDIIPTPNQEYLIYQTLTGIWPMDDRIDETFIQRLEQYFIKALREAKNYSTWNDPDEDVENQVVGFMKKILEPDTDFYNSFTGFQETIRNSGIINSLVQLIIKMTSPGLPDIYQGTELWDLSLVDPDNRRPVNYDHRNSMFEQFKKSENLVPEELMVKELSEPGSGKIKLWLTHVLLRERNEDGDLFTSGNYVPLEVKGAFEENIIAFARESENNRVIVILPLHLAALEEIDLNHPHSFNWQDTAVILPPEFTANSTDLLTGYDIELIGELRIKDLFDKLPMSVLKQVMN